MQVKELLDYVNIISDCFNIIEDNVKKDSDYYSKLDLQTLQEKMLYEFGQLYISLNSKDSDKSFKTITINRQCKKLILLLMLIIKEGEQ
jgi:hypothetical protein